MKLILTEKPSVAADFAKALKASKNDGYFSNQEYFISWAFGHLFQLDDSEFNTGKWTIDNLPLFPASFKLKVIDQPYVKKQVKIIKELVSKTNQVIIAGDAGREGELVQREILQMTGWKGWQNDTFRFWVSGPLSEKAISEGLANMKPSSYYNPLYFSAIARQYGDWIAGINLTRYTTCKVNSGSVWSAGRVQSPTLKIIVDRENEILNFKPIEYYPIKATLHKNIIFSAFWFDQGDKDRRLDKEQANSILTALKAAKTAKVVSAEKKENKKPPLPLFSLTELSKEANRIYGYKLDETLQYAQTLYETYKVLSYPRSDSDRLADDSQPLVKDILSKLCPELIPNIERAGKRVFDSSKLTDHHALIPFDFLPDGAKEAEKNIYNLVLNRFLAAFMEDYVSETTVVIFDINTYSFKSTGKVDIKLGWKARYKDEDNVLDGTLPPLAEGENIIVKDIVTEQKFTTPPGRYTDGTLVELMKKLNLGTVATRAEIVKRLLATQYIIMEKKFFKPTDKGFEFIRLFEGSDIVSMDFIGGLEVQLDEIWEKKKTYQDALQYIETIKTFVSNQLAVLKNRTVTEGKTFRTASPKQVAFAREIAKKKNDKTFDKKSTDFDYIKTYIEKYYPARAEGEPAPVKKETLSEFPCPCKKKGTIKEYESIYRCTCGKMVFKTMAGVTLTQEQVLSLFKGEEITLTGCTGKKGNFDAPVKMKRSGKAEFNF